MSLRDIPLPPNVPRPEMWSAEAVIRAVEDGFTFLLPFKLGESLFSPNAYWIKGQQASACGLTVGPEHTPKIEVRKDDGWIRAQAFFDQFMVPERAWSTKPTKVGIVQVWLEIDPDDVDWEILNRGHQVRG